MSANTYNISERGEVMVDLVKFGPRGLFGWPRWMDDFDNLAFQKGLKVHEDAKNIYVEAVVAGVPTKDVDVDIEDGVVTIKAEKKIEEKVKGEYSSAMYSYYYTCALSSGQWDKTKAEVEDGILTLTIPKAESAKPKKITVKAKSKKTA